MGAHGPNFVFTSIIYDWYSKIFCFRFDKVSIRIDYLLQRFLMLLPTGIKIDPCQYPGSKIPRPEQQVDQFAIQSFR